MYDVFSIKGFEFPKNFVWGSATAGHQIEGNNINSQLWVDEISKNALDSSYELSGLACNSYEMYQEDTKLLKELKHQAYRMSAEWSRIEPKEGEFCQKEVDHYVKVFENLKENGIQICLTVIHGARPKWFEDKGGFNSMDNLKYFERYLEFIVPKFADYIDSWCVLNEHNMSFTENLFDFKMNSVRYHARAYHVIKKYTDKPVSTAHAFLQLYGKRQCDPFDLAVQNYYDVLCNEFFFHAIRTGELVVPMRDAVYDKEIKDTCDFWAINVYNRRMVDTRIKSTRGDRYSFSKLRLIPDADFLYKDEFTPESIIHNLLRLKDKPVVITENGINCDDDRFRIVWLVEYLAAINEVMQMGVDVRGYYHWSLIDNYEWGSYRPRFGLADVDRNNGFTRSIKPSGYFYKEIIENNGYNPSILKKYLTETPKISQNASDFAFKTNTDVNKDV